MIIVAGKGENVSLFRRSEVGNGFLPGGDGPTKVKLESLDNVRYADNRLFLSSASFQRLPVAGVLQPQYLCDAFDLHARS